MAKALEKQELVIDPMWQECWDWLLRWKIIPSEANFSIADLPHILKNGVLLCRLLHKMDEACINMEQVYTNPGDLPVFSLYECQQNVRLFLLVCHTSFGLNPDDLFKDHMLIQLQNFEKVLWTLSVLSQSKKALKTGILGFPNLKDDGFSNVNSSKKLDKPLSKRDFIIKELIDFETKTVKRLSTLNEVLLKPLQECLEPSYHARIFYKFEEMLELHTSCLLELTNTEMNTGYKIRRLVEQYQEKFLVYGSYCANLSNAISMIETLRTEHPDFDRIVTMYEKQAENGKANLLEEILQTEANNTGKYKMFAEKLYEETIQRGQECKMLKHVQETILDICLFLNEMKGSVEHLNDLLDVEKKIINWNEKEKTYCRLSHYGNLIKHVEVKLKSSNQEKFRKSQLFVFDLCVLLCDICENDDWIYFDLLHIRELNISNIVPVLSSNLVLTGNDPSKSYVIVAPNEVRTEIIEVIQNAQERCKIRLLTKLSHKFIPYTFVKPVKCDHCSKYLKGLIFQGYRCHKCNYVTDRQCISNGNFRRCVQLKSCNQSFINDPLKGYSDLWYVGEMDARLAREKLRDRESGTFLVRKRANISFKLGNWCHTFSISLRHLDETVSIAIHYKYDHTKNKNIYALTVDPVRRPFESMENLIKFYQNNSLREACPRLSPAVSLLYPFYELRGVVVEPYQQQNDQELTLVLGQNVTVLEKNGSLASTTDGFWKGRTNKNTIGYFPKNVIILEGELMNPSSSGK